MGTTTPNISIYVPAAGETNYDQAFLAGMLNVDAHNHTGGPDNGVVLGNASLATPYVTIDGTQITLGTPVVNPVWPSRSMFSAYLSADQVNATGDGTTFTIPFNLTNWNQGNNFDTTTGIYTAPVAGKYLFDYQITFRGLTAAHDYGLTRILTTARSVDSNVFNYGAIFANNGSSQVTVNASFMAIMAIGDTARIPCFIANGALVVTIAAGTAGVPLTTFQGFLIG